MCEMIIFGERDSWGHSSHCYRTDWIKKKESPARMQEAHRPPCSKCSLYWSVSWLGGGGTPSSPGWEGGYPIQSWTPGTPSSSGWAEGVPHPVILPPILILNGGIPASAGWGTPHLDLGWGTPHPDMGWGTPLSRPGMGYPLSAGWGIPCLDLGWGTPPPIWTWDGVPPIWTWNGAPPHLDPGQDTLPPTHYLPSSFGCGR